MRCRWCNYDVCIPCMSEQCPCGGKLITNQVKNVVSCDICYQVGPVDSIMKGCSICDWDVCIQCQEEGLRSNRCVPTCDNGHVLKRARSQVSNLQCNLCVKDLRQRKHYCCSGCDYDLCNTCYDKQSNETSIKP